MLEITQNVFRGGDLEFFLCALQLDALVYPLLHPWHDKDPRYALRQRVPCL